MKTDGQNETVSKRIEVKLKNLGTVNKNMVSIIKGHKQVNIYFSYETLVAVNQYVSINKWSQTTGKLLNELQPDKSKRVSHLKVEEKAQELIKEVIA